MELNEIRYFLAVAKTENMHKAARDIGVSAGSLSKAINKLEDELGVKLFSRVGRNIQLTDHGKYLKSKGHDLLHFEESIKTEILGESNSFKVVIGGSEVVLSSFGLEISQKISALFPSASFQFEVIQNDELESKVKDGEVDLGITTYDISTNLDQKILSSISFSTFISKEHPLYREAKKGAVHVDRVLTFPFVVPQSDILGRINKSDSTDGWRDDKFPRKISYISNSLKTIESLLYSGLAIAYLPDFFGANSGFLKLNIEGCPYSCKQKVRLFTKDKKRSSWINELF